MSTTNKFSRTLGFLRNLRGKKNTDNGLVVDELVNPRLGMEIPDSKKSKKAVNSLQLLMYSKENDTLFI
ncbi:hypothetical protein AB3G33_05845 [Flavobacterium sp. WC2421]|jgi:hypothetical protein|uniref:Uncharacterized protein n=3 Tax=unclassified Flavobacterium TaxID=196869 RepID=A0AB39WA90_9FLAO